jgi:cation transport ATPase
MYGKGNRLANNMRTGQLRCTVCGTIAGIKSGISQSETVAAKVAAKAKEPVVKKEEPKQKEKSKDESKSKEKSKDKDNKGKEKKKKSSMKEEKKYKPLISRRILIGLAIVAMVDSLWTDHTTAFILILIALMLLAGTIMLSMTMGCGACWAGFWLSDEKLECIGHGDIGRSEK